MSVDPAMPITTPEELPTADQDVDPDGLEDQDAQDERDQNRRPEDWNEPQVDQNKRPEDWNEPPSEEIVPPPDEPTPLSDDLR